MQINAQWKRGEEVAFFAAAGFVSLAWLLSSSGPADTAKQGLESSLWHPDHQHHVAAGTSEPWKEQPGKHQALPLP